MIDTHCHIDLYSNPLEVALECEQLGITTIGVTNLPSHFEMGYKHLLSFTKVRLALGMHPLYAESHVKEFPGFVRNISKTSYIGEIGLDFSKEGISTKDIQTETFKKILNELNGKKKILSIHSRKAEKEVLFYLSNFKIQTAIFHWYTGPVSLINKIIEAGYYFSINPAMVKSKSGKEIIKKIPLEYLLTESDGPFIEHNGKQIKPHNIVLVQKYLSEALSISPQEIETIISNNFKRIVNSIR
ncbi:MAG: TatD family hydrolase [Bacteroidetes bacterium]|nr:TatD family hydrolase [Bacteroidota bacterium]MBK9672786.1 TatD family hydrolase [Bacteroidota bacterium]MBK9800901.1 TatD family hydrolase [Bacteroidota bacterium]MBP6412045.1 TatD family hydrolase [Bacteroidia bacterium]